MDTRRMVLLLEEFAVFVLVLVYRTGGGNTETLSR